MAERSQDGQESAGIRCKRPTQSKFMETRVAPPAVGAEEFLDENCPKVSPLVWSKKTGRDVGVDIARNVSRNPHDALSPDRTMSSMTLTFEGLVA